MTETCDFCTQGLDPVANAFPFQRQQIKNLEEESGCMEDGDLCIEAEVRVDRKKLFLVSLGHMSCDVNGGAVPALLPFLRAEYGFTYQAAAGLVFAMSCLGSVVQPLFGYVADKLSKPWLVPLGIFLAGCGVACIGFVHSYWAIFGLVMLSGLGAALFHPEAALLANKVSGTHKGTGLSLFSVGGNAGYVLGPLLAAGSVHVFGLRGTAVFGILALIMACVLLVQIIRMSFPAQGGNVHSTMEIPQGAPGAGSPGASENREERCLPVQKSGHEQPDHLPRNDWREFSKLTGTIVVRSTLFLGFNTFIPLYWTSIFMQTEKSGGFALALFCTFGVLSNFVGGFLADRFGYIRVIRFSFLLLVPAIVLFAHAPSIHVAFALMPPLAFALYAPFSSMVVLGQKYLARNMGFASGVTLGLAVSVGGIAAPFLGRIADFYDLPSAVQCMAVISVLGAVSAFLLKADPHDAAQTK